MYASILETLGLSKNEAKIYEALLCSGELTVGQIAEQSNVYRRNVYDCLNRLLEKGIIFEILETKQNRYQAVDPRKLMELIQEDEEALLAAMPGLTQLHEGQPELLRQKVFIYRGIEGWKRYMRDILRVGEDVYVIAGKGEWLDERLRKFVPWFFREMQQKGINVFHLFEHEVKLEQHRILDYYGENCRFLPPGYSAPSAVDVYGDQVTVVSDLTLDTPSQDITITVLLDMQLAETFRVWFKYIWDFLPNWPENNQRFPEPLGH